MPVLSVIVPIFGVEKYIERCVNSLFAQQLKDIEFIFINDCTPDRSMELLDSIIESHRPYISEMGWTIRIEHMPTNSGLPAVRQKGVLCASGTYIIHCDSDDWVAPEMYLSMYKVAIHENADVVICDFAVTDGNKVLQQVKGCGSTNKDLYLRRLLSQIDTWSVWNKMFKRSLYFENEFVFPSCQMGEDFVLTVQLLLYVDKISYIPLPLYYYFYNPASLTHSKSEDKRMDLFWQNKTNADIVFGILKNKNMHQKYSAEIEARKWGIKKTLWYSAFDKEKRELWSNVYQEINNRVITNPCISIQDKIEFVLTYLHLFPL